MELEADNAGITEILEQRSLRLDEPLNPPSPARNNHIHGLPMTGHKRKTHDSLSSDMVNGDHFSLPGMHDYSYGSLGAYTRCHHRQNQSHRIILGLLLDRTH
ncbi:Inhibitor of growth protein 3 [Desmophyllum pertusum]|uniref:Inhibitor of growth protein 3 n=1 Tax=Desmophyllum pertusum TaxID=174260 RepID=A0A9W9YJK5_9CNID|nr:Inhibitor of growth protein 3 [Desmophyllum pertusum]